MVYLFQCQRDADLFYIGKTKRHLFIRMKEHKKPNSSIGSHLLSCNSCCKNYSINSFKILASGTSDYDIRVKEALLIKIKKPILNDQLLHNGSSFFLNIF